MLVLTRQVNEEIIIGDDVRITIVSVSGGQVKIGITAPRGVAVHRKEVYDEICRENLKAVEAAAKGTDLTSLGRGG